MENDLSKKDKKDWIIYVNGMPRISDEEVKRSTLEIDVRKISSVTKLYHGPGST